VNKDAYIKEIRVTVNRISVRVRFCCRSGESATLRLRMSLVSCDLNADNGRYADALIS